MNTFGSNRTEPTCIPNWWSPLGKISDYYAGCGRGRVEVVQVACNTQTGSIRNWNQTFRTKEKYFVILWSISTNPIASIDLRTFT